MLFMFIICCVRSPEIVPPNVLHDTDVLLVEQQTNMQVSTHDDAVTLKLSLLFHFIPSVCHMWCRVCLQSHLPEWADICGGPGDRQRRGGHTKENTCKISHAHTHSQCQFKWNKWSLTGVVTPASCWPDSWIYEQDAAVKTPVLTLPSQRLL